MIIGVTGLAASGKDTVAHFFEEKGFTHISLSAILREIAEAEGVPLEVKNLTDFGNSLREEHGHGYLAKKALEKIPENGTISSIRQVGEVDILKENPHFVLVAVEAPVEVRFRRLQERGRTDDVKTLEEFKAVEAKQAHGTGGAMNLQAVMARADYHLDNSGDLENLNKNLDELYAKITEDIKQKGN